MELLKFLKIRGDHTNDVVPRLTACPQQDQKNYNPASIKKRFASHLH